ncbi:unnamed protein product, partial [Owenia fusiformis]
INVCSLCWRAIYMIPKHAFYKCNNKVAEGFLNSARSYRTKRFSRDAKVAAWFSNYVTLGGCRMPHKKVDEIWLPYKTEWKDVYSKYKEDMVRKDEIAVSYSSFRNTRKKYFSHVKIKTTNSFSRCARCTLLERQEEGAKTKERKLKIAKKRALHDRRQRLERAAYYARRDKSK